MRCVVKLLDVNLLSFKFDDRSFVIVNITIIRSWEYCNDHWKPAFWIPFMHFITFKLCFMRSNNRQKIILSKELSYCFLTKEKWTPSYFIRFIQRFAIAIIIFHRIWPQYITKQSCPWRFFHSFNFIQIIKSFQIRRNSAMNRKKLIIHQTTNRQRVKCIHKQIISVLVILTQHLCSKIEKGSHLSTLMVSS